MQQPTITANVTAKTRLAARRKALEAGKSLREFAGEILEQVITPKRGKDNGK